MSPIKPHAFVGLIILLTACAPQPTMDVPQEFKAGQKYFHKICSNCHGSDAMGKHTKAPRLIDTDYLPEEFSDDDIRQTILNGTDKMPSQKNKVSKEEIEEIIKYLRYSQEAAGLAVAEDDEEEETM
ncbi:MAG: c-type cytochrome [Nitrospinales bacterium]